MPERLTGGGKANLLGSSLQQRECGVGLQHSGLLVIAIAVDHAMGATERSGCIDGVDRGIYARILAGRHGCLQRCRDVGQRLFLLVRRKRLDLLFHHLLGLNHANHDVALHDAAEHPAVGHARIVLEPDRMRSAAPRHGDGALMLTGNVYLEICSYTPFNKFVLHEIVPVRLEDGENRLRRGIGREPLPQHQDVERIEAARFEAYVCRDFSRCVHLRDVGREQQSFGREFCPPALLRQQHPVLFAGRIRIMTPGSKTGFDNFRAVFDKWADHVADDLRALEQLGQRFDCVLNLGNFVVRSFDAGNFFDNGLYFSRVAAGGNKGDVVFPQIFTNKAPRITRDTVDDDRLFLAHVHMLPNFCSLRLAIYMPMPPSTGRPTPVMKRASLEQRKTAASAMSPISPNRPSGVCSTTEATAAPASGASPAATMSLASCMPMSVGTSPG